jgi:hypothetical protein
MDARLDSFIPWENPRYPFYRRLGGLQRRCGRYGGEKNVISAGNRTANLQPLVIPICPVLRRDAVSTKVKIRLKLAYTWRLNDFRLSLWNMFLVCLVHVVCLEMSVDFFPLSVILTWGEGKSHLSISFIVWIKTQTLNSPHSLRPWSSRHHMSPKRLRHRPHRQSTNIQEQSQDQQWSGLCKLDSTNFWHMISRLNAR